jgi:hypothetical protein
MWWPAVVKSEWVLADYGRSPHVYVNQRPQIQLELLMMSGVPLKTCSAFNERWNNKFCYKVASCWLFLLRIFSIIFIPFSLFPYTWLEWGCHFTNMRVIEKLKTQNRWEGKGNHRCDGGNTCISSILPFLFISAFTATFSWPEVSQRRSEKRGHNMVACAGGRVLWHWNIKNSTLTKALTKLVIMLKNSWSYVLQELFQ